MTGAGLSACGLALGVYWRSGSSGREDETDGHILNTFIQIDDQGLVTVVVPRTEMGQGVFTALPMIVADELDADWASLRVVGALANPQYGPMRTGGSTSVRRTWTMLRHAGAAARAMLVEAAARHWRIQPGDCWTERSVVGSPLGKKTYGELAELAAQLDVPTPSLKPVAAFTLVGRSIPRTDIPAKTDGSGRFGIDYRPPGTLTAMLVRSPTVGGRQKRFDDVAAREISGVRAVLPLGAHVAVVADNTWSAWRAKRAVRVDWDAGPNADLQSDDYSARLHAHLRRTGVVAHAGGTAVRRPATEHAATFEVPFLAHGTMEPMNAWASVTSRRCVMHVPTQAPLRTRDHVAQALGMFGEQVEIHTTWVGGGFGRRLETDFAVQAAQLSRRMNAPLQLVWDRDDDFRGDFFRPASAHRLRASLERGRIIDWFHRIAAPTRGPERVKDGLDRSAVEGADRIPYQTASARVEFVLVDTAIPVGSWRGVYHNQNCFAAESFMNELAARAHRDPLEFRLSHLPSDSRHARVIETVGELSDWSRRSKDRCVGMAVHESFGSVAAVVVEVDASRDVPWPTAVFCALDCGLVVNPGIVRAQVEGAVVFGLSAALRQKITFKNGVVEQVRFSSFEPLRMGETPRVMIRLIKSEEPPQGVGEPVVPVVAPALTGAVWSATGHRIRRLPVIDALTNADSEVGRQR